MLNVIYQQNNGYIFLPAILYLYIYTLILFFRTLKTSLYQTTLSPISLSNLSLPFPSLPNLSLPALPPSNLSLPSPSLSNLSPPTSSLSNLSQPTSSLSNLSQSSSSLSNLSQPSSSLSNLSQPSSSLSNLSLSPLLDHQPRQEPTMTRTHSFRRLFLPCFTPPPTPTPTTTTKKRLSTSLRDDIIDSPPQTTQEDTNSNSSNDTEPITTLAPPRQSKSMVIGTIFGQRRGHVWFCVQHDRLTTKPCLLLELSIPTHQLVKEMHCGLVRVALECCDSVVSGFGSCHLHSVPVWTMFCNGKKFGFAVRRKASQEIRVILKTMQSMTVGAGVIPSGFGSKSGSDNCEELMYMRANYECVVGGPDSESFHLINPDDCPGQELSIFLMRSR